MNGLLLTAGVLALLLGAVHSVLGERMIFRHLRRRGAWVPTEGGAALRPYQLRILWASWHLVTLLGWALGLLLLRLSLGAEGPALGQFVVATVMAGMSAGGVLVLGATRGRHPGWLVLLLIAALLTAALI